MKPRITLITLGVDDLEKSLRFYRDGLGFPTEGIIGQEFERTTIDEDIGAVDVSGVSSRMRASLLT